MKSEVKTQIDDAGLRYKSKSAGSPFVAGKYIGASTMSCLFCGKHRERSLMKTLRILGKSQLVCAPSCRALDGLELETDGCKAPTN
jgi:hypothetical protein